MPMHTRIHKKPTKTLDPFSREFMRSVEKRVLIGIPAESMHPGQKGEGPISNAVLGYLFEYGQPERNLPARPHLIPGVEAIREAAVKVLEAGLQAALKSDLTAPERALHKVGLMGQTSIQRIIAAGNLAPLAERTIKGRLRRGRKGTKPLYDTGAYLRSFSYTIQRSAPGIG